MNQSHAMSPFQMEKYQIHKLNLSNPFADFSEDATSLGYFANHKQEYKDGEWIGSVALGFRLISTDDARQNTDDPEVMFEAIIVGDFLEPGEGTSEEEDAFIKKLRINGTTTLIPLLRSAISSAGALMGFPNQYTLPNINVFSLEWIPDSANVK